MSPVIKVPETGREIPVGNGSPVAVNIGDNVTAALNTTITIKCPVSGVPTPSVTWLKDGVQIMEGEHFLLSENRSLVIEGAEADDSGRYTCSIGSAFGKEELTTKVTIIGTVDDIVYHEKPRTYKLRMVNAQSPHVL